MLYFSRLKLIVIYFIIVLLSSFSLLNFAHDSNNYFLSKKVNLGLDLQGGSYLLLEVDSLPVVKEKLQNKLLLLRKSLKEKKIKYRDLSLSNETINFKLKNDDIEQFREYFLNKENPINSYYNKYKSYEMDFLINENSISLSYTKYGIIEIKSSALEQSLEIVRRRIDETGTKEPTIIRRGYDRILIELPGLDDPNRIKNLLGKTANLTFRLISDEDNNFGSELIFYPEENRKISVNKRVVISVDNL